MVSKWLTVRRGAWTGSTGFAMRLSVQRDSRGRLTFTRL
jgi:hypothetical protein